MQKGRVTLKYPYEEAFISEGLRGKPEINFNTCIGCGACVNSCPSNALTMEDIKDVRTIRLFFGLCICCGTCEEICPVDAIRMLEEFEFASLRKEDLEEEFKFHMVECKSCGKFFTTRRVIEDTLSTYSQLLEEYQKEFKDAILLCPECRRVDWLEELANIYKSRST